jgi:hypothetical protein
MPIKTNPADLFFYCHLLATHKALQGWLEAARRLSGTFSGTMAGICTRR